MTPACPEPTGPPMSVKSHALSVDVHDASRLDAMTEAELDALPIGAIRVDADGRILY